MQRERSHLMRSYADLHLCPSLDDMDNARSMANALTELQTKMIGLLVPPDRLSSSEPVVEVFGNAGLDVATRLDLRPRSREELLRNLSRFRGKYEIISVECRTPSVSRVAVRDRRVDIVYFPKREPRNLLRSRLAETCRAALEFNLSELISGPGFEARLHVFKREIETAVDASIDVIGSTKAANPYELRSPRDIAALLHLIGLPLDAALRSVSDNADTMVKKNRQRLGRPQLEEGVRILRRSARHA